MSVRRQRRELVGTELQLTAFINPMVVLVTFLLVNIAFQHASILDLRLPGPTDGTTAEPSLPDQLILEVTVRAKSVEVGDRNKGVIAQIPNAGEAPDYAKLSAALVALKAAHPGDKDATVLVEPDVSYDRIVQVMDAMRAAGTSELFPQIAVGDAPVANSP